MKRVIVSAAILSIGILLSGCASTCVQDSYSPYQQSSGTQTLGSAFKSKVQVADASGMVMDSIMHGRTLLTNLTDRPQTLRYHYVWTTSEGELQGENMPWSSVVLPPHLSQIIQSTAPNIRAINYTVNICEVQ